MARLLSCTITLKLLAIIILLQSPPIAAQNTANISVGRFLTATTNSPSWNSSLNDFAFGFSKFPNSKNLFLLAIWYAKIPNTIVWYANDGKPVPEGSFVNITADQGLVLSDPGGTLVWKATDNLSGSGAVSYGFMNDTGNFVLKNSNSDDVIWQSFEHPTDTLLPTQSMEIYGVVNSKLSENNFTNGRFQLRLVPDGNLVLNTRELTSGFAYGAYYTSGTNENPEISGQRLVYNASGYMFILRKNGSRQDLLPPNKVHSTKDNYQRATLNYDGVLTWYSVPKTSISTGWSVRHAVPENICMTNLNFRPDVGSGICGFNSICSIGDDNLDRRPTCTCPKGYSFLDPNDKFGSCKPDFTLESCEGYAERSKKGEYSLVRLPTTDWPWNDYERLDPCSEEECKNSCLRDCFCAAAMFGDINNPGCWKKKAPLSNGRKDNTVIGTAWIKVGNVSISKNQLDTSVSFPPSTAKKKVNPLTKALVGGFGSVILLSAIGLGIFIYQKRKLNVFDEGQRKTLKEYSNVHCFRYQELREATNGFREELGRGAFGVVYKGVISGGGPSICVAVKKLDRISKDADKEFETELNVIGQTHHRNLVRFIR